jgi:hypothetical protein
MIGNETRKVEENYGVEKEKKNEHVDMSDREQN